ncbi:MAG: hypothetical protein Q9212_007303 [Teloschistes hypoglaucus]
MQAPTQTIPLDLTVSEKGQTRAGLEVGESLQGIIRFDLKEEGNHVLAVSVSYTERELEDDEGVKERSRTFRKLYQFIAGPCLNVRSKVSDLSPRGPENQKHPSAEPMSFVLEAQLENMADGPITLGKVSFSPKPSFTSASINWDVAWTDNGHMDCPFLVPRDVSQAAFLIKQQPKPKVEMTKDGRVILGQLTIQWRTSMGDAGFLTTGSSKASVSNRAVKHCGAGNLTKPFKLCHRMASTAGNKSPMDRDMDDHGSRRLPCRMKHATRRPHPEPLSPSQNMEAFERGG